MLHMYMCKYECIFVVLVHSIYCIDALADNVCAVADRLGLLGNQGSMG